MTYEEQLKDRRWWLTRKVVLIRDNFRCTVCGSPQNLQVHHTYYTSGAMAWDYPLESLQTLCGFHHSVEHGKLEPDTRCGDTQDIRTVLHAIIVDQQNKIQNG